MPDSILFSLGTVTVIAGGRRSRRGDAPLAQPIWGSDASHGNGMLEVARVRGQLQRLMWG